MTSRRSTRRGLASWGSTLTLVLVLVGLPVISAPQSAQAAGLSGTSWSAMDPRTGVPGQRYDWGFTTASLATVSKVTMGVPAGTTAPQRYLELPGTANNSASTPDSAANSITGDFEVRVKITLPATLPGAQSSLIGKDGSYRLYLNADGTLSFNVVDSTSVTRAATSTVSAGLSADSTSWVSASYEVNSGSGKHTTAFATSADGVTWTPVGASVLGLGINPVIDGSTTLLLGLRGDGTSALPGKFHYAEVRSGLGIGGAVTNKFDPNQDTIGGSSWASDTAIKETWTVNRIGSAPKADVSADLSALNVLGLPTGGKATLRTIDGVAVYVLPVATSVSAGVAVSLGLGGFTNTYTAGSPTSALTTYDASTPPASVDTATTPAVAFTVPTIDTFTGGKQLISTTTPVPGATVDAVPYGLALRGTQLAIADNYGGHVFTYDITTGDTLRIAGNGLDSAPTSGAVATATPLGGNNGANYAVAYDGSGNVYRSDGLTVWKIDATTKVITRVVGSGGRGASGDGGSALAATFDDIYGLAVNALGDIWIADAANSRIRYVDHASGLVSTIAGNGTATDTADGGVASLATVNTPASLALDAGGNLLIGTYNKVRRIDAATNVITTLAGTASAGFSGDGGAALAAVFKGIHGVAVDGAGNLYIADSDNHRIRKVTAASGIVTTIAGDGTKGYSGDGVAGPSTALNYPTSPVVDAAGNVYVADDYNARVRKIDATTGFISTVVGTGDSTLRDGRPAETKFFSPQGMASDSAGNVFVADLYNQAVRKVDPWGNATTFAGTGFTSRAASWRSGSGVPGGTGPATSFGLGFPSSVAVAADDTVYIADQYNNRVRKVVADGTISTLYTAATQIKGIAVNPIDGHIFLTLANCQILDVTLAGVASVYANSSATCATVADGATIGSATLNGPFDLCFDAAGTLYFTEKNAGVVRKVLGGKLVTVAGGGASNGDNVAATAASIVGPGGLARDALGNFYVSESTRIKRFTDGGPIFNVAGTAASGYSGDGGPATSATLTAQSSSLGRDIAFANGQLYISDNLSGRIRRIADVAPMAPLVNADAMTAPKDLARSWPILSNDWARANAMDPTSLTITASPAHGTVSLAVPTRDASTLRATFTPDTGYLGADAFTYRACDLTRLCATATVSVTVASDEVVSVAGGLTEGLATNIAFQPARVARYRNYLFLYDATQSYSSGSGLQVSYSNVRRYDLYSKQLLVVAGAGSNAFAGDGGPATAALLSGGDMTFAPDGTLYLADGANNRVRRVATNGIISTVAGTGTAGTPTPGAAATATLLGAPPSVAFSPSGVLHVISGSQVWRFPVGGTMTLVAGAGAAGSTGDGGTATTALLSAPQDLSFNSGGDLYLADTGNSAVRRVRGGTLSTVAGTLGAAGFGGDGGAAGSATVNAPKGIAVDPAGTIYLADTGNTRLRSFTDGGTIATVAGSSPFSALDVTPNAASTTIYTVSMVSWRLLSVSGGLATARTNSVNASGPYSGDGIPALTAQLQATPSFNGAGFTVDAGGNIFVGGPGARIRRIDAGTGLISTYVGDGTTGNTSSRVSAVLNHMTFDPTGHLVFADAGNREVRRVNDDLTVTTLAGNGVSGNGGDGGPATSATLSNPWGVAFDSVGNLFISEPNSGVIRKVAAGSALISTVAGTGVLGDAGDGASATAALLNGPAALATDRAGNLYIADKTNHRIRMVDTRGVITTVAGTGTAGFTGDGGPAYAARVNNPTGLAADAGGNLYVADSGNARIRKVDASTGLIRTVLGTGSVAITGVDASTAAAAVTFGPRTLVAAGGDLYFYGDNVSKIRKAKGLAATGVTNNVSSATWSVVPGAPGHPNLRERFTLTPSASATSAKMTFTVPPGFAGSSPAVVEAYGFTGAITAAISGSQLTISYPAQVLRAGTAYAVAIEGITNGGNAGSYASTVALYDAGSTAIGWTRSTVVKLQASGAPASADAGYGSMWAPSLAAAPDKSSSAISVSPTGSAREDSVVISTTGNLNGNALEARAADLTRSGVPAASLAPVTPDISTGVSVLPINRWGFTATTTGGLLGGALTTPGTYVGHTPSYQAILTAAPAGAAVTLTTRVRVDYLAPVGTYTSAVEYEIIPGG